MVVASANVVMQLGVPGVGHGVAESTVDSGNVLLHPWKRLRTTTSYITVALVGDDATRENYRKAVNRSHTAVRSGPDSPVPYNAFDPALQLWVAACLYVGMRDQRELFLGPLDDTEAEAFYRYCARLGTTLQVREEDWPADREAFDRYWRNGLAAIHYDPVVREHLMKVVELRMLPWFLRIGTARVNRFFTTALLPAEFRTAMALPWSAGNELWFRRVATLLRVVTRLTPRWLRVLPVRLQLAEVRFRIRRGWRLV
ncbi:DUF2236 domain-containing protein [Nocardioides marmoriginsengisoli]|uniref:DUF2236 domain-containing protein n=2 Tax=Nocardioides marmoriginsengisoli TaxID=661483 RepID=A0A3N0CQ92_9ACTN|nr:DUF2236 domain-containing protein [Nocardioides marmoriginsengisoli]